ncbi:DUF58 domain-containing protein [Sulfoacidibacillus thermotolerans]|nr:DUF58 domain-containing protein [Sulfoacidibacillus thermotolerans]
MRNESAEWFLFGVYVGLAIYETLIWMVLQTPLYATRKISETVLYAGATVHVQITVRRSKSLWLLSPRVQIKEVLPNRIIDTALVYERQARGREALEYVVNYELRDLMRGIYEFHALTVHSRDWFGILTQRVIVPCYTEVLVYPRIDPLLHWPWFDQMLRQERAQTTVLADESSQVIGTRKYRPGDPLHHIHWLASARANELRSKEMDYVNHIALSLVFYAHTDVQGIDERYELAISAAASIATYVLKRHLAVEYYDTRDATSKIYQANGSRGLPDLLTVLARMAPHAGLNSTPVWRVLRSLKGRMQVIVTTALSPFLEGIEMQRAWEQSPFVFYLCSGAVMSESEQQAFARASAHGWQIACISSPDDWSMVQAQGSGVRC